MKRIAVLFEGGSCEFGLAEDRNYAPLWYNACEAFADVINVTRGVATNQNCGGEWDSDDREDGSDVIGAVVVDLNQTQSWERELLDVTRVVVRIADYHLQERNRLDILTIA